MFEASPLPRVPVGSCRADGPSAGVTGSFKDVSALPFAVLLPHSNSLETGDANLL